MTQHYLSIIDTITFVYGLNKWTRRHKRFLLHLQEWTCTSTYIYTSQYLFGILMLVFFLLFICWQNWRLTAYTSRCCRSIWRRLCFLQKEKSLIILKVRYSRPLSRITDTKLVHNYCSNAWFVLVLPQSLNKINSLVTLTGMRGERL